MNRMLYGLAALPFVAGVALAGQPVQLTDKQMDKVTAGFDARYDETANTSFVSVSVYGGGLSPSITIPGTAAPGVATTPVNPGYYLLIQNPEFSVAAEML